MRMTWITGALVAIAAGLTMPARAQPGPATADCRVTDLMPSFWPFWEAARDAEPAVQVRLFTQMLRTPHAEVYDGVLRGCRSAPKNWFRGPCEACGPWSRRCVR